MLRIKMCRWLVQGWEVLMLIYVLLDVDDAQGDDAGNGRAV